MRELISLTRQGFRQLTQRGRRVLFGYVIALTGIAALDGFALFLVSKLLTPELVSKSSDIATNPNPRLLVAVVVLFVLRSVLSTLFAWVSLKEFAEQEVEIGQKRLKALHEAPLETRLELNETDFFTAIDRAPTTLVQGFLIPIVNICAESITGVLRGNDPGERRGLTSPRKH